VELFEQIRREYEHGVGTIKGVAKQLGVHRRMVREALGSAIPKERKQTVRVRPKLSACVPFIDGILESDRQAPRKQRHTAHRIWQRLREEMRGVEVAEPTVREYVRKRKVELGLIGREIFIPQSYRWGVEAQVDWYEACAELDGERQKVQIFCLRSMGSGGAYHRAYPHASQQAFLEGHELAFAHFGGVFEVLRYDNLASAVKKILRGHQREETERFIAFRSHWGFQSEFCTAGAGHEKGGVEGEGGYFRRNYLVPVPRAGNLEELNEQIQKGSIDDERRVISGRSQSIGEGMRLEREHLLPLAEEGFDLAGVHFPMVNASGMVRVLTNFYSVPLPAGVEVQVKVHAAFVEIWYRGRRVARHERCFGRQQKVFDLEHYLEVLMKKPGAFSGSTPLEQWRLQGRWSQTYDRFWEILKKRQGKQEGTRAMIEVLMLGRDHGYRELEGAVSQALGLGCSDVGAVRLLLRTGEDGCRRVREPVDIGLLSSYDRPHPEVSEYDQLLRDWPGSEVLQ
jgi:transposase